MTVNAKSTLRGRTNWPGRYLWFQKSYSGVFKACDALGAAAREAGPLPLKTHALVKLALVVGARLEGAAHSHSRRALEAGCTPDEIRHTILLATTTIGFPGMMSTLSWVDDVLASAK